MKKTTMFRGAVTVSALAMGTMLAQPAFAQDVSTDEDANAVTGPSDVAQADEETELGEQIVITGIRASLENSVAAKKANTSIVEVVSAEDIGKLPDVSIAETLSRLPGLATQRLDGRANVVSIRGLAPDFTTTLLNGREQVSANNNRGVELDQYPAELINGAVVYKTPDASLIGQALGGTIDMRTIRPLSHGKQTFVIGGRLELNDLGEINPDISNKGYRANASYVGQFADGTLGIAIGGSLMSSPTAEERVQIWGYPTNGNGNYVIGGIKPYIKSNKLDRAGLMGVVEYEPNDQLHVTLDGYWSQFKDNQRLRGLEVPLAWSGASLRDDYVVDPETNLITDGTFDGVEVVGRNDFVDRDSEIFAGGINFQYEVSDGLMIEADAGYSTLDKTERNAEIYFGTGRGSGVGAVDSFAFSFDEDYIPQFTTGLDYADTSEVFLTAPLSWCGRPGFPGDCQDGFINAPEVEDDLMSLRLQATKAVGANDSFRLGANFSERTKKLVDQGFVLTNKAYPDDVAVPTDLLFEPVSLGFIGIDSLLAFDSVAYYEAGNYEEISGSLWDPSRLTNSYEINEKVLTGFAQYNFDWEMGTVPTVGNIGVQIVHTDQEGRGLAARNADGVVVTAPVTDGDTYTEILPSLNISFEAEEGTFLRFGLARILARARMDQLNPGIGFNYNPAFADNTDIQLSPWSGTVGNSALRPLIANTVDVAVERYFAPRGYVSLSGFYKNLETYIYRSNELYDFTGFPYTGDEPATFDGIVSQWVNDGSGDVYGIEFSGALPFEVITRDLDGFGLILSGSYTDSEVKQADGARPTDLPGLSKWVINSTAYYEKDGFQARISGRYRSEFLAEVAGLSLARDLDFAKGEFLVDAQVGYEFQDGSSLEGLSLLLSASNLTNEPFVTYRNEEYLIRDYNNYGRTFSIGANYRF
ncbi:TonB-dependent receptor [Sphingomicrobium aestuariivivum]|uniref:TonB-dependent receptor n=1 Tax=Sphingomicrobium aestuariivivum TaxID=1582356 RepID=UPI001FD71D63|nr:TonB-dependent receptor [Sphingomicrobium aestuariivivum]MCJ8191594.1 TonB-dependent receptor [Sphingomicrobium aestuariivivum]